MFKIASRSSQVGVGLWLGIAACLLSAPSAEANFTSFGNSGTHTSVSADGDGDNRPQGTMPGAILTPMIRLDLSATFVEAPVVTLQPPEEEEEKGPGGEEPEPIDVDFPDDDSIELMQLRISFTNTRVKDVGAVAIAREGGDAFQSVGAALDTLYGADGTPNSPVNPDGLAARLGASRDGNARAGVYTPDEDPIIAYVPIAALINSATFPLDQYDRNWSLTITFTDDNNMDLVVEGSMDVPPFAANIERNLYLEYDDEGGLLGDGLFEQGDLTPILGRNANVIRTDAEDGTNFATFYVLCSTSRSLQTGDQVNASIDVAAEAEPRVSSGGFGATIQYDGIAFVEDPSELPEVNNIDQLRYVYYDYNNGGLVLRVPQPAVINDPDNDDDTAVVTFPAEDTYEEGPPFPGNMSGALVCMDMVGDQVPARKLNDTLIDVEGSRELGSPNFVGGFFNSSFENRVWSQFPPNFPFVSVASRAPTDPTEIDVFEGRTHPDAALFTDTYPAPEVLAAGGHIYNWFGFDLAGGWLGGYDWRLSGLKAEIQGLGRLDEIPRDGIDNDLDGLTDEVGVEDSVYDRQLPGRNDDLDFYADLRANLVQEDPDSGTISAVDGTPLTPEEVELLEAIRLQQIIGVEPAQYDVEWDPVFPVRHLFDEEQIAVTTNAMGETSFSYPAYDLPDKFYRDLVIPGFVDDELIGGAGNPGLTNRYQPELAILFSPTSATEPPTVRDQYYANLLRIGALQSRRIDEDGDGEDGSPLVMGLFKFADGLDNDGDGLIDEGIDEEVENGIDDDGDGLTDEDVNFVPIYLHIDEEVHNFFVDAAGGRANAFDPNRDFVFIDFNHNGVYDDGRNDQISPNLDEFRGPGTASPLQNGDPYSVPIAFPIDDDLDAEGEDGNPLTDRPAFNGVDDDGDGLADEGANEDVRDLSFIEFRQPNGIPTGLIVDSWMYEDLNGNSRLDPGTFQSQTLGGDVLVQPFQESDGIPSISPNALTDLSGRFTDRYTLQYLFPGSDGSNGPNIPIHLDGKYDFFLAFQIEENMSAGIDFQVSIRPDSIQTGFDTRPNFNPGTLRYPTTSDSLQSIRFSSLNDQNPEYIGDTVIRQPAQSTGYQITKRQIAHLDIADGLGYQSPVEVEGGYEGLPYLDNLCNPFPVLAINLADAGPGAVSEQDTVLDSIRVNFDPIPLDGDGLWDPTTNAGDLRPLSNNTVQAFDPVAGGIRTIVDSGVAIYVDNKGGGLPGEFDPTDAPLPVNLESLSWNPDPNDPVARSGGYYVVLRPQEGLTLPDTDFFEIPNTTLDQLDVNRGYDLFVCVRTNTYSRARNTFRAFIRPGDVVFTNGRNTYGSGGVSHTYTNNVPMLVDQQPDQSVIPLSNSLPVLGLNMLDENNTFGGTPARWSLFSLLIENVGGDRAFTPSDLLPISNDILRNIPLDPGEDNDNDPRTHPIPDGIDNDNDGLIDEGLNNSLDFNPTRYTSLSGVAIFRDMPNSDRNGVFDDPLDPNVVNPDLPVYMSGEENFAFPIGTEAYLQIALDHDPVSPNAPGKGDPIDPDPFETIPTDDVGRNRGNDYFVVVRTSKTINDGDDFRVRLLTHDTVVRVGDTAVRVVVGTTGGFMPGATTGLGPVFPNRQPYTFDPLVNARLVPSLPRQVEEPISSGFLRVPGMAPYDLALGIDRLRIEGSHPFASVGAIAGRGMDFANEVFEINDPFDRYEVYDHAVSGVLTNTEDGSDAPFLEFLQPRFTAVIETDPDFDAGTVFLRWIDSDEDNPQALVTLVYWPMVMDPIFGEIFPQTPGDTRFDISVVSGVRGALELGSDIDDFTIFDYEDQLLADDNENVDPNTNLGTDTFTWDARLVAPGNYRIGAIVDDGVNPPRVVAGGKILITNERPILILTEP